MTPQLVDGSETAPTRSGLRLSADERRRAVITAAVHEFAHGGYAGTSTEAIARRAGISQPYLFRLFQTKKELFLATVGSCFDSVLRMFDVAAAGLEGDAALEAMGLAYGDYLTNVDLLLLQLHAYAASAEPEIREYVAGRFAELVTWVAQRTGGMPAEAIRQFFGMGMLCNVAAALGLTELEQLWEGADCAPPIARNP